MLFSKNKTIDQKQKLANISCSISILFLLGLIISLFFFHSTLVNVKENLLLSNQQITYNYAISHKIKNNFMPATQHAADIKNHIVNTFNFKGKELLQFFIFFNSTIYSNSNPEDIDSTIIVRSYDFLNSLKNKPITNFNQNEIKNLYKKSYGIALTSSFIDSEKIINANFAKNIEKYQKIIQKTKEQNNFDDNIQIILNELMFIKQITNLYFYSLLLNDENIDLYKYSKELVNNDKFKKNPHLASNYQLYNLTAYDKEYIENIYNTFYKDKFGEELHPYFKELIRFKESQDKTLKERGEVNFTYYLNLKNYELPVSATNLENIKAQFDKITKDN